MPKSQNDPIVHTVTSLPADEPTTTVVEKKPNAFVRGFRKIKSTPPKTALAVAGGVALVTAGAMLGRKTANLHPVIIDSDAGFDADDLELMAEILAHEDDTVA